MSSWLKYAWSTVCCFEYLIITSVESSNNKKYAKSR